VPLHARRGERRGCRVWGLGFGVWGLGFGVWGLVCGVRLIATCQQLTHTHPCRTTMCCLALTSAQSPASECWFTVYGLRFKVYGVGFSSCFFGFYGSGFRVQVFELSARLLPRPHL